MDRRELSLRQHGSLWETVQKKRHADSKLRSEEQRLWQSLSEQYRPHRARAQELSSLAPLLDPALSAALEDGTPAALWSVVSRVQETHSDGGVSPAAGPQRAVYTFPVLKPEVLSPCLDAVVR